MIRRIKIVFKVFVSVIRVIFGLLPVWGGIMHFTANVAEYHSDYLSALYATGYLWQIIGIILIATKISIISGYFVPLALVILAPISFNIFAFHASGRDLAGWIIGSIVALCTILLFWIYRQRFRELLRP